MNIWLLKYSLWSTHFWSSFFSAVRCGALCLFRKWNWSWKAEDKNVYICWLIGFSYQKYKHSTKNSPTALFAAYFMVIFFFHFVPFSHNPWIDCQYFHFDIENTKMCTNTRTKRWKRSFIKSILIVLNEFPTKISPPN